MTHKLSKRHPLNAVGLNPLVVSLRYRCACAENEVLNIQVVLDLNAEEEQFIWTMRQLWRDVKFEVNQHVNRPEKNAHHPHPR